MGVIVKDENTDDECIADIEALFEFTGNRKSPAYNGYRPSHMVKENYLTTGVHQYYGTDTVPSDGKATGTVKFITPEFYPHCLYVGKKIPFMDGSCVVGYATVLKIYNHILEYEEDDNHDI